VNTITVRIDRAGAGDGIIAPLHLAGSFSVHRSPQEPGYPTLRPAPQRGSPLDRSASGTPHFAGTLTYGGSLDLSAGDARRGLRLGIPNTDWRAACTLRLNGFDLGARAWHPYIWTAEASALRPGANRYELEVDTDLLGYFEGQRYDPKGDRYLPTPL
jgi:hypothetical protein